MVMTIGIFAAPSSYAQDSPQSAVAAKSVKFGVVGSDQSEVASAIRANDLDAAAKMKGKQGSFKGTVAKVFVPRSGAIVILNFDPNYKNAVTAVLKKTNFSKFPDLNLLNGKTVMITGKFVEYRGAIEIELTDPAQVKVIE